ncbi:MAG: N-acetylmuramoyl-L-alanine amidase [Stigonema ocellatum SAG 48.90 = DSM 106950]|nr:N-acetylmuramoyl-L-alanine amidase [Stigonema ocellatum SAG 48.90 = DSM 106950]
MKFGIDIGHNCFPDTGVLGIQIEEDILTLDVGTRVIYKLRNLGHEVIECNPTQAYSLEESLSKRCYTANTTQVDIFVSIHFNNFNLLANGTEVYAISASSRKIALPVLDEIVKLGFFNRGIKNGSHLYVLRNIDMPGILVECCFCDAQKDMRLLDTETMANAIVNGLTGELPTVPIDPIPDEEQNLDTTVIRLQKALNQLKITDKNGQPLLEDNNFGVKTISALHQFQEIVGIEQTETVEEATWKAINVILAKRIIRVNHPSGPVVRYLQHRLGGEVNDVYDVEMEEAVKTFQRHNGLLDDGILGPLSWQKLID